MATSLARNDLDGTAAGLNGNLTHWTRSDRGCGQAKSAAAAAGIGVTATFCPGQTIVIEGDPITHYFRIVSGTVRLYKAIADGRRQVIDFLDAGSCFGLTGLAHHSYTAEAVSPVTLIRYPRQALEAAIDTDPELARGLIRLACLELGRAQTQMLLLGRKSADEKIASFLLGLAERARDEHRPAHVVHLPMSRQDMADYLGLTIETVSRTLSRFRRDGLIGLPGRQEIVLRQLARLEALADGEGAETRPFQPRLEAEPLQA